MSRWRINTASKYVCVSVCSCGVEGCAGGDRLCYGVCGGLLVVTVDQQTLVNSGRASSLTKTLVEEEQVLRDSLERDG